MKKIIVTILEDSGGGYTSFVNEYPECVAEGNTIGEALTNIGKSISVFEDFAQDEALKDAENILNNG